MIQNMDSKMKNFDNEIARATKRKTLIRFIAECQLIGVEMKVEKNENQFYNLMEKLLLPPAMQIGKLPEKDKEAIDNFLLNLKVGAGFLQ
jgi:hypothetical protein